MCKLWELITRGDIKRVSQEVPEHPDGDNHGKNKGKKPSIEANGTDGGGCGWDCAIGEMHSGCTKPATNKVKEMEAMFLRLGLSQTVAMKLVYDQGIYSPWTFASLSDDL